MAIHYMSYSVSPEWKKQIKKDPYLSKKEKRSLIWSAEFDAFKDTALDFLGEVAIYLISVGIMLGIYFLIAWMSHK